MGRSSARRRRTVAGVLALLMLAACTGPTRAPSTPTIRDPLADLDRSTWSVVDAPTLLALPLDRGTADAAAWAGDGIDDARIAATRQAVAGFVATAYMGAEALRRTDDAGDKRSVLGATPAVWKNTVTSTWSPTRREFYATEFARPYRVIGRPRATAAWYLSDRDGAHRVELGGTIAYSVIDTRTGRTGVFAERFGISAVPSAQGDSPAEANNRIALAGMDICRTDDAHGLIVPALEPTADARSAQKHTMADVVGQPAVSRADLANGQAGPLEGRTDTAVPCASDGG